MKKALRFFAKIGAGLLALILVATVVINLYFPRYLLLEKAFDISTTAQAPGRHTVMSYNIRCWTFLDLFKRNWLYRTNLVTDTIAAAAPDILGLQEVTQGQYAYLQKNLAGYASAIGYRDDSLLTEGCPIFWNTVRYSLEGQGSFWLSETPDVMSKGWDAGNYRICTYAILQSKEDGRRFAVFNTHLDHISEQARVHGMAVVLEKIRELGGIPVLLMGDFNTEEESETYAFVADFLQDTKYAAADSMSAGTYQNWGRKENTSPIDYIFATPDLFQIHNYQVDKTVYDGVYPSDHYPVCVTLGFAP